jgi:hypothetical protein
VGGLGLKTLVEAAAKASKAAVNRMLDIQLNWSEYFQGEWTVRESSGFGNAIDLAEPFRASNVFVTLSKEAGLGTGVDGAVRITLNGIQENQAFEFCSYFSGHGDFSSISKDCSLMYRKVTPYFRVVSKNSRPQRLSEKVSSEPTSPYRTDGRSYNHFVGSGVLSVTFMQQIETTNGRKTAQTSAPQHILSKGGYGGYSLLPSSNQMEFPNAEFAPLISPVFYVDDVHTFFVEPSLTETKVDKWQGYTIPRPSRKPSDYVLNTKPVSAILYTQSLQEAFERSPVNPIDPLALHAIKTNVDTFTELSTTVQFGDVVVDRQGIVSSLNRASI